MDKTTLLFMCLSGVILFIGGLMLGGLMIREYFKLHSVGKLPEGLELKPGYKLKLYKIVDMDQEDNDGSKT